MDQIGYKKQMKGHLYISVRKREKKKGGEEKNPLELSHRSPICTSSPNRKRMTRCFKHRSRRRCMHYLKGISGAHSVACAVHALTMFFKEIIFMIVKKPNHLK